MLSHKNMAFHNNVTDTVEVNSHCRFTAEQFQNNFFADIVYF